MAIALIGRPEPVGPGPLELGPAWSPEVSWERPTLANTGLGDPELLVPATATVPGKYKVNANGSIDFNGSGGTFENPVVIENVDFGGRIAFTTSVSHIKLINCRYRTNSGGIDNVPNLYGIHAQSAAFGSSLQTDYCDLSVAGSNVINGDGLRLYLRRTAVHKSGKDLVRIGSNSLFSKFEQCYFGHAADPYYDIDYNTSSHPNFQLLNDPVSGAALVHGDGHQYYDIFQVLLNLGGSGTVGETIGCGFDLIAPQRAGGMVSDDPGLPGTYGGLTGTIFIQTRTGNATGTLGAPLLRIIGNWGLGGMSNGVQTDAKNGWNHPSGFELSYNDFAFEYNNAPYTTSGSGPIAHVGNLWSTDPAGAFDPWIDAGTGWPTD